MNIIKNVKHRQQMIHSPKVERAYHQIRQDMTIGSCILQGISLLSMLVGIILFTVIIFGFVKLPLIIADVICVMASLISYHHFCILMARRMNKKHQH